MFSGIRRNPLGKDFYSLHLAEIIVSAGRYFGRQSGVQAGGCKKTTSSGKQQEGKFQLLPILCLVSPKRLSNYKNKRKPSYQINQEHLLTICPLFLQLLLTLNDTHRLFYSRTASPVFLNLLPCPHSPSPCNSQNTKASPWTLRLCLLKF